MEFLRKKQSLIEKKLSELLPEKNTLFEAARYSTLGPGKRIRPILTLATVEAFGKEIDSALTPACALELLHTYSLIHDDLPSMDNDDFRRGKPSLHKAYPEAHAILTGDFLLTYAFEIIATQPTLKPEQKIKLIQILSLQSGGEGMIAGQILDLESEGKTLTLQELETIHQLKTGGLITASVQFGGVLANCSEKEMQLLEDFAKRIGLLFQIVDDILDSEELSSDLLKEKSTYVSLLGLEKAKEKAHELLESALKNLNSLHCDSTILEKISHYIIQRLDE